MKADELVSALADFANSIDSKVIDPKSPRRRLTRAEVARAFDAYMDQRIDEAIRKRILTDARGRS